jgi:hypothetical protein
VGAEDGTPAAASPLAFIVGSSFGHLYRKKKTERQEKESWKQ